MLPQLQLNQLHLSISSIGIWLLQLEKCGGKETLQDKDRQLVKRATQTKTEIH